MSSLFRTNALNSSKPASAKVYTKYVSSILNSLSSKDNKQSKNILNHITHLEDELQLAKKQLKNTEEIQPIKYIETFKYQYMHSINLLEVSPTFRELVDNTFIINDYDLFDGNWIIQSSKYANSLSLLDKITILGYTYRGDEYINAYLRNSNTFLSNTDIHKLLQDDLISILNYNNGIPDKGFPFFAQLFKNINVEQYFYNVDNPKFPNIPIGHINSEGAKKVIKILNDLGINTNTSINDSIRILEPYIRQFGIDLEKIINSSPKVTKNMKVYRGVNRDYLKESVQINGFTSTTLSLYVAEKRFSNYNKNNTIDVRLLYEIIIKPDIPCIFLPPEMTWPGKGGRPEFEVLINPGVTANPSKGKFKRIFNPSVDNLLYSFKEFRGWGEEFKTRTIALSLAMSGGKNYKRKITYRNKNKKLYRSIKYTKKQKRV